MNSKKTKTVSVFSPEYIHGYTLEYSLSNPPKKIISPVLPEGWRWLKVGETIEYGDVAHDKRILPVKIIRGGDTYTKTHHPVRRKIVEKESRPKTSLGILVAEALEKGFEGAYAHNWKEDDGEAGFWIPYEQYEKIKDYMS